MEDVTDPAFRLLCKYYPDKTVPTKSLKAEQDSLRSELDALRPELDAVKADLDELKTVRSIISPPEEKSQEKEEPKATVTQASQEKASLIDRLHEKQEFVKERDRQTSPVKKKSLSRENEL